MDRKGAIALLFTAVLVFLIFTIVFAGQQKKGVLWRRLHIALAVLTFITAHSAIALVEITVRQFGHSAYGWFFFFHMTWATAFLVLLWALFLRLFGLVITLFRQSHKRLGYSCLVTYAVTFVTGMMLLRDMPT